MKALVTGGGGFLGRYIVKTLLKQGWKVRVLGRKAQPDLEKLGIEMIQTDIANKDKVIDSCIGCETVFHTAALAGIWGSKKVYEDTNILGTQNIIDACIKHKVKKLVYTSSPSVTFHGKDQIMVNESEAYPNRWLCEYPRTKAIAEKMVLSIHQDQLKTIALRPHLIWGPEDQHLIPRLIHKAKQNELRIVGSGENKVDMVYVQNAADAHLLADQALTAGHACGEAFFITNDEPVLLWSWIQKLLETLNLPSISKRVSPNMAYLVGSVLETIHQLTFNSNEPKMTRFLARQLSTHHTYSIKKATQQLNYHPSISMDDGFKYLISSLKSQ